jgi:hypothetical protein
LQQGKKWGEWQNAKKDETGEDLATVGTTAATFFPFFYFSAVRKFRWLNESLWNFKKRRK